MKNKWINKAVMIYAVVSAVITLSSRIVPWKIFIGEQVDSMLFNGLAIIGGILLLIDVFTTKAWSKGKYIFVLYAFIVVMGISSLINIQYGYIDNAKTIIWTCIQFGIFYTLYLRSDKQQLMKGIDIFWASVSIAWFLAALFSIGQYCVMASYTVLVDGSREVRQGFVENRLFGIFNDPNYAAITSLCVIIAMIYLGVKYHKRWIWVCGGLNSVVQIFYIVLSGSRTTLVCAIAVCCCFGWCQLVLPLIHKSKKKALLRFVCIPVLAVILVFGVNTACQKVAGELPKMFNGNIEVAEDVLARPDVTTENISNNRTYIWSDYIKGLKGDVLFGGSPRNVLEKWIEKNPDSYLAATNYETHNGYLYVLAGTGIVGFGVLIVYAVLYLKEICYYIRRKKCVNNELLFVELILIALLVYTFFFTELFFIHNFTAIVFWSHCGASLKLSEANE